MSAPKKIEYHDVREEASKLPDLVGRSSESERLTRTIERRAHNNALIVGTSGIGKTALAHGWLKLLADNPAYDTYTLAQFSTEHIYSLENDPSAEERYAESFLHLPACIVFIDDFGREVYKNASLMQRVSRLYKHSLRRPDVRIVLSLTPQEYAWIEREFPAFVQSFETILLKEQTAKEYARILRGTLSRINMRHRIIVPDTSLDEIVSCALRFPSLGQLPRSAVRILDESLALSAASDKRVLGYETVARVIEAKTGIPRARLAKGDMAGVKSLENDLNVRIVDQKDAIARVARTIQRAKLGLRNPDRPLGSFLLLGPSGVGKTETAKCLAEIIFGRKESFVRFDMSEYQQDHTVQRLIGSPAGYVGFEEGGALTNALRSEPYSLILLDEIEKAHPKVFDIFLQVLDDGRLTSGQNETVDAKNAIIMATSNTAVAEILEGFATGEIGDRDRFIKERVMPILAKTFRLEFLNRFDDILIFNPLTLQSLLQIARLEIGKVERRLEKHRVRFDIDPKALEDSIRGMTDPRFGARPVKRFIEETCETLLMDSLLQTSR